MAATNTSYLDNPDFDADDVLDNYGEDLDSHGNGSVDIDAMLELQLSEVEMLQSMFSNAGEFVMDDASTVPNIQGYLSGKVKYEYLYNRVGFSIHLPKTRRRPGIEVVCHLPHEYPTVLPEVFIRVASFNRELRRVLLDDLDAYIISLERGELCIGFVVQWIQDNFSKYTAHDFHIKGKSTDRTCGLTNDKQYSRLWIYSHHIYNKFKRRDILDWASELQLTGFSMPGKPGVICAEGMSKNVDEYWLRLRRLNWKRLAIKDKEEFPIKTDADILTLRKFTNFEEKVFGARIGKGREIHMDLGLFYQFLAEHNCSSIFSVYFGVDGKAAD